MKKRILALAMTIAMVFSSMAVLSTVSFAADDHEDCVHFDETLATVDAYHATVAVDGSADAYVMVQEYLANGTRYGVAWDYDYIYVIFAAATKKLTAVEFTVGATDVKVDVATATVTGVEGAKAKGDANYLEVAIPLSEVTLHFTQTIAYAPLTLKVTSDATSGATSEVSVNAEITGERYLAKYATYENNTSGFQAVSSVEYPTNDDLKVNMTKAANGEYTFSGLGLNAVGTARFQNLGIPFANDPARSKVGMSASWSLYIDEMTSTSTAWSGAVAPHVEKANINAMGLYVTARVTGNTAYNGETATYPLYIYNNDTTGLTLSYEDPYGWQNISLTTYGVAFDKYFDVKIDVATDRQVSVFVNGNFVVKYTGQPETSLVSGGATGGLNTAALCGIPESDLVAKLRSTSLATVAEVDYARIKAVSKNETVVPQYTVAGLRRYEDKVLGPSELDVNLGSMTSMNVTWSKDAKTLNLLISVSNLSKITLTNGDATGVIAIEAKNNAATSGGSLTSISGISGATAKCLDDYYHMALVTIPLREVTVEAVGTKIVAKFGFVLEGNGLTESEDVVVVFNLGAGSYFYDTVGTFGNGYAELVNRENIFSNETKYVFDHAATGSKGDLYFDLKDHAYSKSIASTPDVLNRYIRSAETGIYISADYKFVSLTAAPYSTRGLTLSTGSSSLTTVFMCDPQPSNETDNLKMEKYGTEFTIQNLIPDGETDASKASLHITIGVVGKYKTYDLGVKVGQQFNLSVMCYKDATGKMFARVFVDGEELITMPHNVEIDGQLVYAVLDGKSGHAIGDFPLVMVRGTHHADDDQKYTVELSNYRMGGYSEYNANMTNAQFMALTKNTVVVAPEYEDEDEALELKAVQTFKDGDTVTAQRFVATIDSLDYKYAGFQTAKYVDGTTYTRDTYRVFTGHTSIIDGEEEITADEGEYFVTYTLEGNKIMSGVFFIRAFVVDADRNFTYGDTYKVEINGGVVTSAELVTNPAIFG